MRSVSLLMLRASVALLVLIWGIDKVLDVQHAINVSNRFYFGILSFPDLLPILGVAQCVLAILALVGLYRWIVDPVIAAINLGTVLSVRASIIDPWGWYLEETNNLFFPSLTVFAGCLVLLAFRKEEILVLDTRRLVKFEAPRTEPG